MTAPILFSSATDEWPTPRAFFAKLNRRYHFTLDPCARAAIENPTGNVTVYRDSLEDLK